MPLNALAKAQKTPASVEQEVILENVGLKLDSDIDGLLSKEFLMIDGATEVAIGGEYAQHSD